MLAPGDVLEHRVGLRSGGTLLAEARVLGLLDLSCVCQKVIQTLQCPGLSHFVSGACSCVCFAWHIRVPMANAVCLVSGDFWLGLEKIHHLVQEGRYDLLIELEDWEGNSQVVQFVFSLGGESTAYTLNLLGPLSGELENAIGDFRQLPFSTRDRDHDLKADTNCAKHLSGQYELFLPRGVRFPFSCLVVAVSGTVTLWD